MDNHTGFPLHQTSLCPCGGICIPGQVTFSLPGRPTPAALVRNVPAEICQNCGEAQFSLNTTLQLMSLLQNKKTPQDFAVIPIFDMGIPEE